MSHPSTTDACGLTFHLRTETTAPARPTAMLVAADADLTDDEVTRLAQIIGYAWAEKVRGNPLAAPLRVSPSAFILHADSQTSPRRDLATAFAEFESLLCDYVVDGTPIRKTNRSGPGTKGTRHVDGLGEGLFFVLYYDRVDYIAQTA